MSNFLLHRIGAITAISFLIHINPASSQVNYNAEKSNVTAEDINPIIPEPEKTTADPVKKKIPYDPIHPPNTYRNPDNPNYWKNRPPFPGYWQQDVYYRIKADIDEKADVIRGNEELTYWNYSPDTLNFVYFHLYQNAFQPGSYFEKLNDANNEKVIWGDYEEQGYGTVVEEIRVSGKEVKTDLDNTIMKVILPEPLVPGDTVGFRIKFTSYFDEGGTRRRMKLFRAFGYKHFDGVHWYPRLAVYDRKFGWETDQHLGHEFYGDFGTYDVELTFANNYVVDATGELQNRKEALPDDLRKKLDITNFKNFPLDSTPTVIIPYDSTIRKTWHYYAENVPDFAFTADPTYRIGEAEWKGIKCIALAQEPHASRWQNAAEYTANIIKLYSEDIGMYAWNKIIVADARDGMEYPMLTLDGGLDPDYRGLFMHEVGHNWFYGQVANNETYRAFLDEGFTTFITTWAYEKLEGKEVMKQDEENFYKKLFKRREMIRDSRMYQNYLNYALRENDVTLNTHSDDFNNGLHHGGGYRQAYHKTATMLFNLQYALGDELFLNAMQHYFSQWRQCHPYPEDFRNSIIQYAGADLNWFFDEWLETTKTIDYSVGSAKKITPDSVMKSKMSPGDHMYRIIIKRKSDMQMPLDFTVITRDGKSFDYHIPNGWFEKKTTATVLPRWIGWGKLNPVYKANLTIPGKIYDVVLDPSNRLADIYMPDNARKRKIKYYFDSRIFNQPDWKNYEVFMRPDVWYNGYDGIKAGFHINGNYMNFINRFRLTVWFNTGTAQYLPEGANRNLFNPFSYSFRYNTPATRFSRNSELFVSSRYLDGLNSHYAGFEKCDRSNNNRFTMLLKTTFRSDSSDLGYLLYPELWEPKKLNNIVKLSYRHLYKYKWGRGDILLSLLSSAIASDYDYAQAALEVVNENDFGKVDVRTRTIMQYGTGRNPAPESNLFFAGASPEELMDNKFTRSVGIVPYDWVGYGPQSNHFQHGGGLNMRGFAGYLVPVETKEGEIRYAYSGTTGAALNTEVVLTELIPLPEKDHYHGWNRSTPLFGYDVYLFGDCGIINYNYYYEDIAFTGPRLDAGIGFTVSINRWGPVENVAPLVLRFDIPFYLYPTPALDTADPYNPSYKPKWNEVMKFRWSIGLNRTF